MAVKNGTPGADTLLGTTVVDTLRGLAGNDKLQGLAGIDLLDGGLGDDRLIGDGGDDSFIGGAGKDTFEGGVGADIVGYFSETGTRGVIANLATGKGTDTFGHADRFIGIEDIIGSNRDDKLTGNNANGALQGLKGNDVLVGAGGIDDLIGDEGNDKLYGDAGNDNVRGGANDDLILGSDGTDRLDGGAGIDLLDYGAERGTLAALIDLRLGTGRDTYGNTDKLIGFELVAGSNNPDRIVGFTGRNDLFGGLGSDTLAGGPGADNLDGEVGNDTVDYSFEKGIRGVTVNLAAKTATDTYGHKDKLISIENATGTLRNDKLTGNTGVNTLSGGGGNDEIIAGGGKDTLSGDAGNDTLTTSNGPSTRPLTVSGSHFVSGGDGNDTIYLNDATIPSISGGAGIDTLMTSVNMRRYGDDIEKIVGVGTRAISIELQRDEPGDVTGNSANNTIVGGSGADTLRGGRGNDNILGHNGSDDIQGDEGADTLTGGVGGPGTEVDRFHATVNMGADTITDFAVGIDKLVGASGASIATNGFESTVTCAQGSFKLQGVYWIYGDFDSDTQNDDIKLFDGNFNTADQEFFNTSTPPISLFVI